jgi:hypothetical protein
MSNLHGNGRYDGKTKKYIVYLETECACLDYMLTLHCLTQRGRIRNALSKNKQEFSKF